MGLDDKGWIRNSLAHQQPPKVPFNLALSPPARKLLVDHYGKADLETVIGMPMRFSGTETIKPLYASPDDFGDQAEDEFGVTWATSYIDRGSPVGPCLPEPDLSRYGFPDPTDASRFERLGGWTEANKGHFTVLWIGALWERATFMRGMEPLLLDLALNPEFVEELLHGLTEYILRTMEILFARFEFDGVALSDDYGAERSMLMSPAHWRRFIKPRLVEIYELAKRHNRVVFHHSCGHIKPIIGEMIDIGLDILHPIQPEAMDVFQLKREFGADVTFCGGVRTQDLLPRGTPAQIREEVKRLQDVMGKAGGYILEPGITVQADVPLPNLLALIEAAQA